MFFDFFLLTIITMAFSQGIFLILGFSTIVPRMIMELSVVFLFLISIFIRLVRNNKVVVFGLLPVAGLFLTSLISRHINSEPLLPFLIFLRHTFIFYVFFIALLNLELRRSTYYRINKYLIFLFIIQIPANIVKFFIVGVAGIIIGKSFNNIFSKSKKNSTTIESGTQTELTNKEIEEAILCKKDLDAINTGTYEWKFV